MVITGKKRVQANNEEDYGDTVVCCSVCGRIAIGKKGEDFSKTVCVDCGNNEWKELPFTKGANIRKDPNDAEIAKAGIRRRRVGASIDYGYDRVGMIRGISICKDWVEELEEYLRNNNEEGLYRCSLELSDAVKELEKCFYRDYGTDKSEE